MTGGAELGSWPKYDLYGLVLGYPQTPPLSGASGLYFLDLAGDLPRLKLGSIMVGGDGVLDRSRRYPILEVGG